MGAPKTGIGGTPPMVEPGERFAVSPIPPYIIYHNRELCAILHCSTRGESAIISMGKYRLETMSPPEKRLNMLSDAKKRANAKWDKAHMMILGCKVRKDFAAQFREACTAAGTTPNAVLKQAAEQFLKEHPVSEGEPAGEECA